MKIFIPNRYVNDETLLQYAVRSWVEYCFDAEVVIVGPKPSFDYAADGAEIIETNEKYIHTLFMDLASKTEAFVWSEPNIIVCNYIHPAHVMIPKRLNPHTPYLSCPQFFVSVNLRDELEQLPENCTYEKIVHEYHAHCLYNIAGLTADWRTDNITLPMVSKTPDERKARSLAATKMFLWVGDGVSRSWLKNFLAPYFPDKQRETVNEGDEEG